MRVRHICHARWPRGTPRANAWRERIQLRRFSLGPPRNAGMNRGYDGYSFNKRTLTFLPFTFPALSLRTAVRAMLRSTATYVENSVTLIFPI